MKRKRSPPGTLHGTVLSDVVRNIRGTMVRHGVEVTGPIIQQELDCGCVVPVTAGGHHAMLRRHVCARKAVGNG